MSECNTMRSYTLVSHNSASTLYSNKRWTIYISTK